MLTQTSVTGTDDWWVMQLATQLGADFPRLGKLRSYYDGTVLVPDAANRVMRNGYARFINMARLNMARPIVQSVTSRQVPVGFRTAAADDVEGDSLAMTEWRRSHMPVQSRDLFEDIAVYGRGYTIGTGDGRILKASPWNAFSDASVATPWDPEAAITAVWDPVGQRDILTLFRPAADGQPAYTRRAQLVTAVSTIPQNGTIWYPGRGWDWIEDPQYIPWAGPLLPVVAYEAPGGMGQFEAHTDALDRVNHTVFQRMVIVAMQAFRQRAIKGNLPRVYPADHPQAGQQIDYSTMFEAGPDAFWILGADADMWESQVTDITPITSAITDELKILATVSGTPLWALVPDAANQSANGAELARETIIAKVNDLNERTGESLAIALALSFAAQGDAERSDPSQIETLWRDVNPASLSERAAAAAQAANSLPQETIWREVWQFTPSQIEQAKQDRSDAAFAAPAPAPAGA